MRSQPAELERDFLDLNRNASAKMVMIAVAVSNTTDWTCCQIGSTDEASLIIDVDGAVMLALDVVVVDVVIIA